MSAVPAGSPGGLADPGTDPGTDPVARAIGAAVRRARARAGLSTRELAHKAGVSQPFVSTLENGLSMPSVATLYKLAAALDVSAHELLPDAADDDVVLVRAGTAPTSPVDDTPGAALSALLCGGPDQTIEAHGFAVEPGQWIGGWFDHPGEDFVHVIEGRLVVELATGARYELVAGDSLWHRGGVPHRWSVGDDQGARVLLINAHAPGAGHRPH